MVAFKAQPVWVAVLYVTSLAIWKARNKYVMKKQSWSLLEIISNIQVVSHLWITSRNSIAVGDRNAWIC